MNNIYKVIWSKAKNCYVVASEIARSHTKSASGSEKIGGGTRRKLLASLMALSLLCGGLGVAEAAVVHVNEGTGVTYEVYTTDQTYSSEMVDEKLNSKANATDVVKNTKDIATNKDNITRLENNKADKTYVDTEVGKKADRATTLTGYGITDAYTKDDVNNALNNKADKNTVNALVGHVGDLETTVGNASKGLVKDVNELKAQRTTLNNALEDKVNKADLNNATNRIAANEGEITALKNKTGQLSADGKELKDMTTVSGTTVSGTNVEAGALKVTGVISNDLGVTTTLDAIDASMTQTVKNKEDIATLQGTTNGQQTAINGLNEKTTKITYDAALGTKVDGVTFNAGKVTGVTSINGIDIGDAQVDMKGKNLTGVETINGTKIGANVDGNYIHQDSSIWGNMKEVDTQVGKNAAAIAQEKTDREKAIGSLTGDKNYIKKANNVSDNLVELDKQAQTNADNIQTNANNIKTNKDEIARVNGELVKTNDYFNAELGKTNDYFNKELSKTNNHFNTELGKTNAALQATNKRTAGIGRTDTRVEADNQTVIEGTVHFDQKGNMSGVKDLQTDTIHANGEITSNGLNAGDGEIKTNGKVSAGDVSTGTLETTGNAKIGGDLTVDGKLNVDKISMKNDELKNGKKHDSATTITADEISNLAKVTEQGNTTESQFTHNEKGTFNYAKDEKSTNEWKRATSNVTADGVSNTMTDSDGNTHTYYQTATETKEQLVNGDKSKSNFEKKTAEGNTISITEKDADGNLKSSLTNTQTVNGEKTSVTNEDSSSTINQGADQIRYNVTSKDENKTSSSIEVKADGITNTSKDGTITNTAKNVTNEGTESVTNKVGTNEVKVSKDGVDIKVDADKTIKESVGAVTSRTMTDGNIIDQAGDMTVTTDKTTGTTFGNGTPKDITVINGGTIGTNKVNANETNTKKLTAGAAAGADGGRLTVDANDGVKGSYKYGDYTSRSYILANTLQSGVDNGKDITDNGFVGSRTDHYMDGDKAKLNETVKDADGSNVTKKTSTKTYTEIKDTNGNTLSVNQKADGNNYKLEDQDGNTNHVTNSATQSKQTLKDKDGNTLTTNQTATKNNFDLKSADGSKENHTTNTVDESRVAIKGENGKAELSTTDEGTTFKHSAAKEAFTEGGATNTTIKGNTITTGKVTMDYAKVMKDLGVTGNAKVGKNLEVTGKTTTGSLEVTGTSTLNGEVIMGSNATVRNNLTVNGTTKTRTLNVTEDAEVGRNLIVRGNATIAGDVSANSYSVEGKTYINKDGINANNQKITNVADGSISEGSKDAVNGGQLYGMKTDLEHKVDKVGANAAAMANLHPMEFDPDSKWNIAAAMGNYGSETATAIGAFYRPNEDVMVNFSTAFGTGENMVGGGVSVRLGKGSNKLSREESNALKDQVDDLTARMDALLSVLNPNMSKDFPDVPENHWAYEAVSRLAGNDIVQGYPDGEFHGDRTMTRYEMAEIIYNALSRGAEAERELVEEFKPELQAMAASEKATAERAEG